MIALKAVRVVGSYVGSPSEMAELMAMARTAPFPELPLACAPLAAAGATLDALKHGRVRDRAVLKP